MPAEPAGGLVHPELRGMGADMGLQQCHQGLSPCPCFPTHPFPVPSYPLSKAVICNGERLCIQVKPWICGRKIRQINFMARRPALLSCDLWWLSEWVGRAQGWMKETSSASACGWGCGINVAQWCVIFLGETGSFTKDRKNVSEKRLLKYWVPFIYGIYTHTIIYLHAWM